MSFVLRIVFVCVLLGTIYSCAKKNSTSPTPTNQTVQTNPNTSFSVDGVLANQPNSAGSANSTASTFIVTGIDYSGYPQITITFPHTTTPTGGTYSIVSTNPNTGFGLKCNFALTQIGGNVSPATSGTVSISTVSTHSYEVVFSNISCSSLSAGTHMVSGTIGY